MALRAFPTAFVSHGQFLNPLWNIAKYHIKNGLSRPESNQVIWHFYKYLLKCHGTISTQKKEGSPAS
jgi:glutathione peroxidase-family protein